MKPRPHIISYDQIDIPFAGVLLFNVYFKVQDQYIDTQTSPNCKNRI